MYQGFKNSKSPQNPRQQKILKSCLRTRKNSLLALSFLLLMRKEETGRKKRTAKKSSPDRQDALQKM
jgi:hypothetical protein